jgi:hypothetical protein
MSKVSASGKEPIDYGKPVTVKLSPEQRANLDGFAIVDEKSFSEEFRMAVNWYVANRVSSPDFPTQIEAAKNRTREALAIFDKPSS